MAYYWFLHHLRTRAIMVARGDDTIGNSNLVAYIFVCHIGREKVNLEQFREFREFKESREFRDNF